MGGGKKTNSIAILNSINDRIFIHPSTHVEKYVRQLKSNVRQMTLKLKHSLPINTNEISVKLLRSLLRILHSNFVRLRNPGLSLNGQGSVISKRLMALLDVATVTHR